MNIAILDRATLGDDTPINKLEKYGTLAVYEQTARNEIQGRIKNADVVIVNKIRLDRNVLKSAQNLKLICVFATGYDNIDVAAADEFGIAVCNVPKYSTDSVALYTVATVLSLYTSLLSYSKYVKSGLYTASGIPNKLTPVYHELREKTWGIVGCGSIGSAVARVAMSLGARVIVNKRTPTEEFEWVDIDTLCRESDIITIHCPLNDESRELINAARICLMKPNVCIVNAARGAVVDERAICDAIKEKKIGSYGTDVYTEEPLAKTSPYQEIMGYENVILTPHCAWGSYESRERCLNIICSNIEAFIRGESLNRVDKTGQS